MNEYEMSENPKDIAKKNSKDSWNPSWYDREIINVHKDNQTLCHQLGAHQKLNTDVKRRIVELTLSDANLSDQKIADIIEHESRIIIFRC
jgi:hypothetical protein